MISPTWYHFTMLIKKQEKRRKSFERISIDLKRHTPLKFGGKKSSKCMRWKIYIEIGWNSFSMQQSIDAWIPFLIFPFLKEMMLSLFPFWVAEFFFTCISWNSISYPPLVSTLDNVGAQERVYVLHKLFSIVFFFVFLNHFHFVQWLLIFQSKNAGKFITDHIRKSEYDDDNDNAQPNRNGFISLLWFHNALGKRYLNLTIQWHWNARYGMYVHLRKKKGRKTEPKKSTVVFVNAIEMRVNKITLHICHSRFVFYTTIHDMKIDFGFVLAHFLWFRTTFFYNL